jgi:hypothetical protein
VLLEGEFDGSVLRGFNQKNTAFEQLREKGLEVSRDWPFEVGRGEVTRISVVVRKKKMYKCS